MGTRIWTDGWISRRIPGYRWRNIWLVLNGKLSADENGNATPAESLHASNTFRAYIRISGSASHGVSSGAQQGNIC